MSRVLLTGMTAQQANPASHRRVANFTGLLRDALRNSGHNVFWQDPSVKWTRRDLLNQYDKVIVGIGPITSLGSNRSYGALSIIEQLWGHEELVCLIEAPQPNKVTASIRSIMEHPKNLTKDFFSYRKEYMLAKDDHARLLEGVHRLGVGTWPITIVPGLPWSSAAHVEWSLPAGAHERVRTLNLDQFLLRDISDAPRGGERLQQWSWEPGADGRWLKRQHVTWPVKELPRSSRHKADGLALQQLSESTGCLIGTDRSGTWWNTRYAQALSQETPVFTSWEETQGLGSAWTMLPSTFECLTDAGRRALARDQAESYLQAIGSDDQQQHTLHDILKLRRRGAR